MQPLGLTPAQLAEYHTRLLGSHTETVVVDVLDLDGVLVAEAAFTDGQINLQRESLVRRDATVTISDPDRILGLESGPWQPTAADRLLRVSVSVECSWGPVTASPFVGQVTKVGSKDGCLQVTAQDLTVLGVRGSKPVTFARGENAIDALARLYRDILGYPAVRFPSGLTTRLAKPYSIGWADDAAPEVVAAAIAKDLLPELQLLKSCDGVPTLREKPVSPVLTIDVTTLPEGEADLSAIVNAAVVPNTLIATLDPTHPWSPQSLTRNGAPLYMPIVLDAGAKDAEKRALAALTEASNPTMDLTFSALPALWHLDDDDLVTWRTPDGDLVLPWSAGSLPLGSGGDASVGSPQMVSRAYGKPVIQRIRKGRR